MCPKKTYFDSDKHIYFKYPTMIEADTSKKGSIEMREIAFINQILLVSIVCY